MDKIIIEGNQTLSGNVKISGAKNSVLPIMAASILGNKNLRYFQSSRFKGYKNHD